MKKSLILFSLIFAGAASSFAQQQVTNSSFDTWGNYGPLAPQIEDPTGWVSFNVLNAYTQTPISVTKASPSHTGAFAAKIRTVVVTPSQPNVPDTVGVLVTGVIILQPLPPTIKYGTSFTYRPGSMSFYATYAPMPGDTGFAWVLITRKNPNTQMRDTIGSGFLPINATANYTQFNVPITYVGAWAMPDSAIVYFSSSKLVHPKDSSVLVVDDVSFGVPNTIEESAVYAKAPAFPNPANNVVNINTDKNAASINVYDVTGRMVGTFGAENKKTTQISTSAFDQGIYIYRVLDKSNTLLYTGKFSVGK